MRDDELQSLCAIYQKLLRMCDWVISVKFADALEGDDKLGTVEHQGETQSAVITLLSKAAYATGKASISGYDVPRVLCHELLHCKFYMLGDEKSDPAVEFAIDSVAEALVCLNGRAKQ